MAPMAEGHVHRSLAAAPQDIKRPLPFKPVGLVQPALHAQSSVKAPSEALLQSAFTHLKPPTWGGARRLR